MKMSQEGPREEGLPVEAGRGRTLWLWVGGGVPLLLMMGVLGSLVQRGTLPAEEAPPPEHPPVLEALCFNPKGKVTSQVRTNGDCPAPGYVKLLFLFPRTRTLTVGVFSGDETVFVTEVDRPRPRRMMPEKILLEPGQVIRIVLDTSDAPASEAVLEKRSPTVTVRGVKAGPLAPGATETDSG